MSAATTEASSTVSDGSSPDEWTPLNPVIAPASIEEPREVVAPKKPWFSGHCGSSLDHGCADGRTTSKAGERIYHCRYVAENGFKAAIRFLYCACACHDDHRVETDPLFGSVRRH